MAQSRGKEFEGIIKRAFMSVPNTNIIRLHDQTNGYLGGANHCDFIAYHYPYEYHLECKSIHGNTFPIKNITDTQYRGLMQASKTKGIIAGVIIWFVSRDRTMFVPIQIVDAIKELGYKSIRFDESDPNIVDIPGEKKRVYFTYNMKEFIQTATPVENKLKI